MPSISINIPNTTFVSSSLPNNNMNFYPVMYIGTDPSYQSCNGLLQFALPALPVTSVDSAVVQFSLIAKDQAEPSVVVVNRATSSFSTSTVTYNTQPTYTATASQVSVNQSDLYQRVSIDITSLVNNWLAGTYVNDGIVLTCSGGAVQFATNAIVYEPYFPTLTLTYSSTPSSDNSAFSFIYAQLSNILQQLMTLYPDKVMTIYTSGAYYLQGIPYEFYASPDATYGTIAVLSEGGGYASVPITNISAITVANSLYDPSISYLPAPVFAPGCDKNVVTSIHDYLPVFTNATLDLNTLVTTAGLIYKNEYGMLVKASDMDGTNPVFVPVWSISAIETATPIPNIEAGSAPNIISVVKSGDHVGTSITERIEI
nr:DNRLRE domain-containing protein [uncultured Caproiciproducens sp.]